MPYLSQKFTRVLLLAAIFSFIALVTLLHYTTSTHLVMHHGFFKRLYYLPIILASLLFGLKTGLLTSTVVSLVFLPHIIFQWRGNPAGQVDQLLEILLFNLIAFISGKLIEREKREREEKIRLERTASLGKIASQVAASLKAPVHSIWGSAEALSRMTPVNPGGAAFVNRIKGETEKIRLLLQDMEIIKTAGKYRLDRYDVNDLLKKAVALYWAAVPNRNCRIHFAPQPGLPAVLADGEKMSLVFHKILNYLDFHCLGDEMKIVAERVDGRIRIGFCTPAAAAGRRAKGEHLFQGERVVRDVPRLGLFVADRILSDHGGNLLISNDTSREKTVHVILPIKNRLILLSSSNGWTGKAQLLAE